MIKWCLKLWPLNFCHWNLFSVYRVLCFYFGVCYKHRLMTISESIDALVIRFCSVCYSTSIDVLSLYCLLYGSIGHWACSTLTHVVDLIKMSRGCDHKQTECYRRKQKILRNEITYHRFDRLEFLANVRNYRLSIHSSFIYSMGFSILFMIANREYDWLKWRITIMIAFNRKIEWIETFMIFFSSVQRSSEKNWDSESFSSFNIVNIFYANATINRYPMVK